MATHKHLGRVAVTGASGFLGRHLIQALETNGFDVLRIVRKAGEITSDTTVAVDIRSEIDWAEILAGCHAVVHLAGVTGRDETAPGVFREVNDLGTMRIVTGARRASVSTLIHASTVAVKYLQAAADQRDVYAASKKRAEAHVSDFGDGTNTAINLRLPLVYAADASGKWKQFQRLAASPLPLPFASISNRRGVLAIRNFSDAVLLILRAKAPSTGSFDLSDGPDVSTGQLMSWLRRGMGRAPRLFPLHEPLLRGILSPALGKSGVESLIGDFPVPNEEFRRAFDWQPLVSTEQAVTQCGRDFAAR